jgi:C-terminal processing protease CtpA/Prc
MVHHVDPGSLAESAGLNSFDLVMSVGGTPVDSLETLHALARQAEKGDQPLELMLLRLGSGMQEQFFIHQLRLLPVEDLQPVGP